MRSTASRLYTWSWIHPEKKRFLRQHTVVILAWIGFCIGIGALLAILLASLLSASRRHLEGEALAGARLLASTYAQQISRTIGELDHTTSLLRSIWAQSRGTFKLEDIQRETNFADSSLVGFSVIDRHGVIVSSTLDGAVGMSVADRAYFKLHQSSDSGDLKISQAIAGRLRDREIVVFSRRLSLPSGEFGGVITASTGTPLLAEFADASILGQSGLLALVGEDKKLRVAKINDEVESVLRPNFLSDAAFSSKDAFAGASPPGWFSDNMTRYLASTPVPGYPLHTIVGLGESDVLKPLIAEKARYQKIGLASGAVLVLFAFAGAMMSLRLAWRKHSMEAIRNTYRIATEGAREGFYMWRPIYKRSGEVSDYEVVDCNERGAEFYGKTRDELKGLTLKALYDGSRLAEMLRLGVDVAKQGFYEDEVEFTGAAAGNSIWIHQRFVCSGDSIAVTFRDITQRKLLEQEKLRLAEHDSLTELPNRHWLTSYLPLALERTCREKRLLAVLFVDLDKFKVVNDAWGHSTGDKLLHAVAQRMRAMLRPADTVVRFGGDEFIVLLEGIQQEREAAEIAQRIADVLEEPFRIDQRECTVGASIGISVFPKDGKDAETLIKNADIAMYSAKSDTRRRYQFFNQELFARMQSTWETERELAFALEKDQFVIHYQPRVDALTGALAGFEALVRWQHPTRGLLYPGSFIDIAETSGLILRLGDLVMEKVCSQLAAWRQQKLPLVPVSINASAKQFNEGCVTDLLAGCVARFDLPASLIEIELTESTMVTNEQQVAKQLTELRAMGVAVHLDDFGTGYSSLSMLYKLDVDVLKVDRSFTAQLGDAGEGEILFKAIISMAQALGMRVVAEGVETHQQQQMLMRLGCNELQGFLISKPRPASDVFPFCMGFSPIEV